MRIQLYKRLADAFKVTITDVYDDHAEEVAFIPPFAALVLERSESLDQVLQRLLEVRDDYAILRRNLAQLEAERVQARSIKARQKIRRQQRALLNDVASAFDRPRPSLMSLEGIIRYIPNVIKAVIKPSDPSQYNADLLLLPAKDLATWWRQRPIAKLFRLADKLNEMETYEGILHRLFGEDLYLHRLRE